MKATWTFTVRPRYTASEMGVLSEEQAMRFGREEIKAYRLDMSGTCPERFARASRLGLGPAMEDGQRVPCAIVEMMVEHKDHWFVVDMVTGVVWRRHFDILSKEPIICRKCDDMASILTSDMSAIRALLHEVARD